MKANEAPEKIYILPHKDYSDKRIMNAFTEKEDNEDIEYVRKDAFIKEICEWVRDNHLKYPSEDCADTEKFIKDFRNFMERK